LFDQLRWPRPGKIRNIDARAAFIIGGWHPSRSYVAWVSAGAPTKRIFEKYAKSSQIDPQAFQNRSDNQYNGGESATNIPVQPPVAAIPPECYQFWN